MTRTERGERAVTRTMSMPAAARRCERRARPRRDRAVRPEQRPVEIDRREAMQASMRHGAESARATSRMLRGHRADPGARLFERHVDDRRPAQRDHPAEPAGRGEVGRSDAEPRPEHAVGGRRGAAALQVTEHRHAGLEPRQLLEPCRDEHRDAAEALEAERVDRRGDARPGRRLDALRDDDDRVAPAARGARCARRRRRPRGRTAPRARGSRPRRPRCPRTSRSTRASVPSPRRASRGRATRPSS